MPAGGGWSGGGSAGGLAAPDGIFAIPELEIEGGRGGGGGGGGGVAVLGGGGGGGGAVLGGGEMEGVVTPKPASPSSACISHTPSNQLL